MYSNYSCAEDLRSFICGRGMRQCLGTYMTVTTHQMEDVNGCIRPFYFPRNTASLIELEPPPNFGPMPASSSSMLNVKKPFSIFNETLAGNTMRVTLNFLNYSWRHDPKQSTHQVISCSSLKTLWMMVSIPHHSATNFLSVFYPTTLEIFEHLCLMTSHTYYWNIFISITDNSNHFSIMNTEFRLWILWLLAYF